MYKDILQDSAILENYYSWEQAVVLEKVAKEYRLPTLDELKIISASCKKEIYGVHKPDNPWFWTSSKDALFDFGFAVNFNNGSAMPLCTANKCNVRLIKGTKEDVINWCFDKTPNALEEKIDQILKNTKQVRIGQDVHFSTSVYSDKVLVIITHHQNQIAMAALEKEAFLNLNTESQRIAKDLTRG